MRQRFKDNSQEVELQVCFHAIVIVEMGETFSAVVSEMILLEHTITVDREVQCGAKLTFPLFLL